MTRGRRILRVARNLLADRRHPPLARLQAEKDPDRFLWMMLPHAARTFSLAIAVLPPALGRSVAIAYLCCRLLDTIEDLARDCAERERLFDGVAGLVRAGRPLPELGAAWIQDARDRAHLILVRRSDALASLLDSLPVATRERIAGLSERMASGMRRAARVRDAHGGIVAGEERALYCQAVLAEPLMFAEQELRSSRGLDAALPPERREPALRVGELIQLANVCRDVEKDLRRGVAYDDELAPWVGRDADPPPEVTGAVRTRILERVAGLSASIVPYFTGLPVKRASAARGASLVLLITTARFFQRVNAGLDPRPLRDVGLPAGMRAAAACAQGVASAKRARQIVERAAAAFAACRPSRIDLESAPR